MYHMSAGLESNKRRKAKRYSHYRVAGKCLVCGANIIIVPRAKNKDCWLQKSSLRVCQFCRPTATWAPHHSRQKIVWDFLEIARWFSDEAHMKAVIYFF
jgi:hypothetical protein